MTEKLYCDTNLSLSIEYVAGKLGNWLSKTLGWKVTLGTAIVPNWRDGRITLKDVTIDFGDVNIPDELVPPYEEEVELKDNYTRFSLQLDRMDVRISLRRWLEGRGWLEEVLIDGARGTLDKRWTRFIEGWRWKRRPGDFDLDSLQLRNVHLNIVQPRGYRPYSVTILSASVPRLRASWLFYDLLSVESAHGIFDGRSLFTLHSSVNKQDSANIDRELKHFRMLGLDVRHLSQSSGDSALGWVTRGTVDIEGFYQLPKAEGEIRRCKDISESAGFEDSLLEKLLSKERGGEKEDLKGPLRFWYESKLRPSIPNEFIKLADNLVSLPERISDRISQSKDELEFY